MRRLTARQSEVPSEREGVEPRCRCNQVGGPEPGDETQASVVKDCPSGDRGFATTSPAHKAQASALPGGPAATDRTSEPVGPTTLGQVAPTSRVIGKRRLELRQGCRERSAHSSNYEVVELSGQAPIGYPPAVLIVGYNEVNSRWHIVLTTPDCQVNTIFHGKASKNLVPEDPATGRGAR